MKNWLGIDYIWEEKYIPIGRRIPDITLLFERIDKKQIIEEVNRLKESKVKK